MLSVNNLTVRINGLTIVDDISFEVKENEWLMLAGPNGAGKSTLVKAIAQALPYTGTVTVMGQNAGCIKPVRLAKLIGVLGQSSTAAYAFTVDEVVRMGRYAYRGSIFAPPDEHGEECIDKALAFTGMQELRHQSVLTLSGGELRRAFLAQVFAQDPSVLLLDEPTNHLDIGYQSQIFELISSWVKKEGKAVISVVHELNLAKAYGDKVILMHKGQVAAMGTARQALNKTVLEQVYGMDVYAWMNTMMENWQE